MTSKVAPGRTLQPGSCSHRNMRPFWWRDKAPSFTLRCRTWSGEKKGRDGLGRLMSRWQEKDELRDGGGNQPRISSDDPQLALGLLFSLRWDVVCLPGESRSLQSTTQMSGGGPVNKSALRQLEVVTVLILDDLYNIRWDFLSSSEHLMTEIWNCPNVRR